MEWSWFVEIIAAPIIGWLVYKVSKVQSELTEHQVHVAEKYVSKDDAEKAETKIYKMLETVNGKLDRLIERQRE